jgi:hypothetical protein
MTGHDAPKYASKLNTAEQKTQQATAQYQSIQPATNQIIYTKY